MANKKNGGNVPSVPDDRVLWVPVGCGKCIECKKQKARQWQVRLTEDIRHNKNAYFVTYTFNDRAMISLDREIDKKLDGYDRDNAIVKLAIRRYTERWRKKYKKTLRHWLVTEIGGKATERVHIHGIVWTNEKEDITKIWNSAKTGPYGFVYIGEYVNEKTINYIIKYVSKIDRKHKEYKQKIFTSKGIGVDYLKRLDSERNEYKGKKTCETYKTKIGLELALPIYYRNKIYNENQREKLWLDKLDKKERWVLGERVDVSENDTEYFKLLKYAREKNDRLGYGNDKSDDLEKEYERKLRNLKRLERVKKVYG